ncbi:ATP-grasp domain-containing protein [Chromobacterium vaccinii]|uniref:ATP-grasp domain-containing protein n=1 Tax=Chromobacterium vaccinii TaxID=1108595 RepID=A0A1D9LJP3_9NEIS|nr:hypothetical protein [Chromobacterium vaccinii]AOZ51550.1 hypothetical protein BKX93_17135 [Chromobacterium vaccinii]
MTSENKRWLLLVDYNLSRVGDVACMFDYARTRYQLSTILIRHHPSQQDHQLADAVIDLNPLDGGFVDQALQALQPWLGQLAGGLVFSDNAVASGASLLRALGLPVDDADLAQAAFSKSVYRQREQKHAELFGAQSLYCPPFQIIRTQAELAAFAERNPEGFVLKPSCEGNNRGVLLLKQGDDLAAAWQEVLPYLDGGLIAEGYIPFHREYSFDGIGNLHFITEKISASGRYPVETGQLLPARLQPAERHRLIRAGQSANLLVGQFAGPFHNEVKLDDAGARTAVIEPNRRPAGMKIWHLAERVYRQSFYQLWVDSVLAQALPQQLPAARGQAATMMLGMPRDGELDIAALPAPEQLLQQALQRLGEQPDELEFFEFAWLAPARRAYPLQARDNGDFPAQVCVYTPDDGYDLHGWLQRFQQAWASILLNYLDAPDVEEKLRRPAVAIAKNGGHGFLHAHH